MAHKILLVDDDKVHATLVKIGLTEKRYKVVRAQDGDEGLEKLRTEAPDLILLDVQMPRMNGYEFVKELKKVTDVKIPPVIVYTTVESMKQEFLMEGIAAYFIKPVQNSELIAKVIECIGPNPVDS